MHENHRYQQIYQVVTLIPCGRVASYGQVADLAGLPGRARFAGRALKHTPGSLILPWHRVVRSDGYIAFSDEQADKQRTLLNSEGVVVTGRRVKMQSYQWQPPLHLLLHELSE